LSLLTQESHYYTLVPEGINNIFLPSNSVLITDKNLVKLFPLEIKNKIFIPPGEEAKTLEVAERCWQEMHRMGLDRQSTVVAFGGGSVTDLAGFAAATYMRGIASMYIPTTLLGMVDAAIGGKTGINLPTGKSMVGCFHLPERVYIIPELLKTLPRNQIASGMAEVIKYGVIHDSQLFRQLEELEGDITPAMIERCCAIKSEIVSRDAHEKDVRVILNYGHTFAHAIETATVYSRFLHGEAVAIGMSLAAKAAEKLGWVDSTFVRKQNALIQKFGLPTTLPPDIDPVKLISLMKKDKKATDGKIRLILPKEIGTVLQYINNDDEFLKKVLMSE